MSVPPPTDPDQRLQKQIEFLCAIDDLKGVLRQTTLLDGSRNENSAEHSWHLALYAIVLAEYGGCDLNLCRVLQMVLVHDIVEIDAGDTYIYDEKVQETKEERERRAADRLFKLLPDDQARVYAPLGMNLRNAVRPKRISLTRSIACSRCCITTAPMAPPGRNTILPLLRYTKRTAPLAKAHHSFGH